MTTDNPAISSMDLLAPMERVLSGWGYVLSVLSIKLNRVEVLILPWSEWTSKSTKPIEQFLCMVLKVDSLPEPVANPCGRLTWEIHTNTLHLVIHVMSAPSNSSAAYTVPNGWKLIKDTTNEERTWAEDAEHENGNYFNNCSSCGRTFVGHKRRVTCKACATGGGVIESSRHAVATTDHKIARVVEAARFACWCPDAGGFKNGRSMEDCYEELHDALQDLYNTDLDTDLDWITEEEFNQMILPDIS